MKTKAFILSLTMAAIMMIPQALLAQTITETRETGPFDGIEAGSMIRVVLTQGDYYSVKVEAPEEHLPDIETRVERSGPYDILKINYTRHARNLKDVEVRVTAPAFLVIHAVGASSVVSSNTLSDPVMELVVSGAATMRLDLDADQLTTTVSGASGAELSGEAALHILTVSGVSRARTYELITRQTRVRSSGTSSVRLTATDLLDAEASGTSSIVVRGNPEVGYYSASTTASIRGVEPVTDARTREREERRVEADPGMQVKEAEDTLVVRMGSHEVTITEGRRVNVRRVPKTTWRNEWTGLYLGINGYMTTDNGLELPNEYSFMDLEYNRSISVNLNLWQQNLPIVRGANSALGLVTGLGFGWNNYRFRNNIRLVHEEDQLSYYTDTVHNFRKNKLTVSHLNVPFMLEFQARQRYDASNRFHMAAGLNVGIRLRSHTKQVYRTDGSRQKDKDFKDFHLVPFRYEAIARIGWGRVNLFATYALNELFREDKGPELVPFNVGIRLLNF